MKPQADLAPEMLEAIEAELQSYLDFAPAPYGGIAEMLRHHFGWDTHAPEARGKRIRPLLTLLSNAATGGDWRTALPAAAAIELIHNFTLVHDDIEDASETRRGRPTVWFRWGIPQAVNTGDFLYVVSHLACHRLLERGVPAEAVLAVRNELDLACLSLSQGQHLDIAFESRDPVASQEYLTMIAGKTAALLGAACAAGAIVAEAGAEATEACRRFGRSLGMAFQLMDDLIGIWGDPRETGKSDSDDLRQGKKTYPVLLGMQRSPPFHRAWASGRASESDVAALQELLEAAGARQATQAEAERYTHEAQQALDALGDRAAAAAELRALAARLLHRDR
ncbi:MAG TPA: polyprenyl synthetase family protein [Anaerolineales bacterium]|nr:polyprenyl synthetase family protein [Anaerolineales bacterium]